MAQWSCYALGYAGTADLLIEHPVHGLTLVDLKTQGVKPGNDPSTYKSWGYQLAAYGRALGRPVACMNLIVNSREAHPPVEAPWTEPELERCWEAFDAAMALWRVEKNFDPRVRAGRANGETEGQALAA